MLILAADPTSKQLSLQLPEGRIVPDGQFVKAPVPVLRVGEIRCAGSAGPARWLGAPEARAPPVQGRPVLWPWAGMVADGLEAVKGGGPERIPAWIEWFVFGGGSYVLEYARLLGAEGLVVALALDQRELVGAAGVVGPARLDEIVLPEADRADFI